MNKSIYFFTLLLICCSCLTEIEFDEEAIESVVVSGVITNSWDERTIFVNRSKGIETEAEKISATGAIYKNGELDVELVALRPGELVAPIWFEVREGESYHIEITTEEQQVYQSIPQVVQPKLRTDSLSFALNQRQEGFNRLGAPIYIWLVDVYAHINIPAGVSPRFYKWHVDEVWSFESDVATCYIHRKVVENPITAISSKGLGVGSVPVRIASAELDDAFFYKHYFNAYLHSIDETSFDFYNKVNRLTQETGSLYDELPAPVKGNIFLHQGTPETVLGNVEFSLVDTLRLAIENSDIDIRLYNVCESDNPCTPAPSPSEPAPPCVCANCVQFFGIGSLRKPLYWED